LGSKIELLKKSYELLLRGEDILKSNFDYESNIVESFIDEIDEIITIKDNLGSYIQYDICDCYTALIKITKIYNNDEIHNICKELKKISLYAELI
jgi:hypothetical protein